MKPINTIGLYLFEPSKHNIHVPTAITDKYPGIEFRGKPFSIKNKNYIRAKYKGGWIQIYIGEIFYYCFEDDFFHFSTDFKNEIKYANHY